MGSDPYDDTYKSCICYDCGCGCANSPGCQGAMRWVIFGFMVTAAIFAYIGTVGCQFLLIGNSNISIENYDRFGLFRNYVDDSDNNRLGCISYPESFKDNDDSLWNDEAFQAGQAFSMLTLLIVTSTLVLNTIQMLFVGCGRNVMWHVTQYLVLTSIITNVCQFAAFGNEVCTDSDSFFDVQCVAGASGIIASINTFILLTICILMFTAPPPRQPLCMIRPPMDDDEGNNGVAQAVPAAAAAPPAASTKAADPEDDDIEVNPEKPGSKIDVMIVNNADGTRTTTRTVTNPDGSKTVTKTIEEVEDEDGEDAPSQEVSGAQGLLNSLAACVSENPLTEMFSAEEEASPSKKPQSQ